MKRTFNLTILFCALSALPLCAQQTTPPAPAYQALSSDQLDELLGPIALYPDPLISEILPAATFPNQIGVAGRYLTAGGVSNKVDQQSWDPSVQALTHYPTVLKWMDENQAWTTELGKAFLNQQQEMMDSLQRLRKHALNVGNLKSTPQQEVVNDTGDIEILPAGDDTMYLPEYQDNAVYYEDGYPVAFGPGFPIGAWLRRDFDWHHHQLVFWDNNHPRPHKWWCEPVVQRDSELANGVTVWHPEKPAQVAVAAKVNRGSANPEAMVNRAMPGVYLAAAPPVRMEKPTPAPDRNKFVAETDSEGSLAERSEVSHSRSTGAYNRDWTSREHRLEPRRPTGPEHPAEPAHFAELENSIGPEHPAEPAHLAEPEDWSQPEHWSESEGRAEPEYRATPEYRHEPEYRSEPVSREVPSYSGGVERSGGDEDKRR